jgi:hypothetical protein
LHLSDDRTLIRVFDTFASVGLISQQLWAEKTIHVNGISERGDSYVRQKTLHAKRQERYREKQRAKIAEEATKSDASRDASPERCDASRDGENVTVTRQRSDTDPDTDPKEPRSDHSRQESKINSALGERCVGVSGSFEEDSKAQSVQSEQHSDVTPITSKRKSSKRGKKGLPRLNSRAKVSEYFSRVKPGGGTDKVLGQIERLAEFAGFLDWYASKVCGPCGAELGALEDSATAWLSLEASDFLGRGYEDFRQGCMGYLKKHKGGEQIGVRHACRFLVGGPRCGSASWLGVVESAGSAGDGSAFLKGVDDSHDLEATRQNIGLELARCALNSVLPTELAAKFGKQMASQLDASESVVYLQWLRSQPSREVQHAV